MNQEREPAIGHQAIDARWYPGRTDLSGPTKPTTSIAHESTVIAATVISAGTAPENGCGGPVALARSLQGSEWNGEVHIRF